MSWLKRVDKLYLRMILSQWRCRAVAVSRQRGRLKRSCECKVLALVRDVFGAWRGFAGTRRSSRRFAALLGNRVLHDASYLLLTQVLGSWARAAICSAVGRAQVLGSWAVGRALRAEFSGGRLAALALPAEATSAVATARNLEAVTSLQEGDVLLKSSGKQVVAETQAEGLDADSDGEAATEAEAEAEPLPADSESSTSYCTGTALSPPRVGDVRPAASSGASACGGSAAELQERVEAMIVELQSSSRPVALGLDKPAQGSGEESFAAPSSALARCPAPVAAAPDASDATSRSAAATGFKAARFPGRALLRRLAGPKLSGRKGGLDSSSDSDLG